MAAVGLSSKPCDLAKLLFARPHTARLLFSGGCCSVLLHREPDGQGAIHMNDVRVCLWISLLLILLGVFLRSVGQART
jgi:hypothetical protein